MTRIKARNIQLEGSFVVPIEESANQKKIQAALEKEKEIILQGEQKAAEIIAQAQAQADQIIEEARDQALSEVDAITQKAHDEGFEAGRQEGLENITNELQDKIIAVNDFAESNFEIKQNIIKSAHLDIIRLIVEIAQKICSKSLELDDNVLKEITSNAIHSLKDKEAITIIVNPEMAEKIYAISEELKEQIQQLSSIKIVEDNSVSPDGTIVESPLSRVDSRIRSQINEIADKLMAKLDSTEVEETEEAKCQMPNAKETGRGQEAKKTRCVEEQDGNHTATHPRIHASDKLPPALQSSENLSAEEEVINVTNEEIPEIINDVQS